MASEQLLSPGQFRPVDIAGPDDTAGIAAAREQCRRVVLCVLNAVLERAARAEAGGFIDTKLDIATGRDFAADDPLRGRGVVYTWIQGRGLEALAGHLAWLRLAHWLDERTRDALCGRCVSQLHHTIERMERLREAAGGRLTFMMHPDGAALDRAADGAVVRQTGGADARRTMGELFYFKGLYAAAGAVGDEALAGLAREALLEVLGAVDEERFVNDQVPMAPPPVPAPQALPGRHHSGRMIGLGGAALLAARGDAGGVRLGGRFIGHILAHHTNANASHETLRPGDMWEMIDGDSQPLRVEGQIASDPGHSTEFVGLAMKFRAAERPGGGGAAAEEMAALRRVLVQNFANGRIAGGPGIVKAFDLASRRPISTDMPWWSLPETIRGALAMGAALPAGEGRRECVNIAVTCSNLFLRHYIRPKTHLMSVQTLAVDGKISRAIPATPDADPGYHTGLSLIDADGLWSALLPA